MLHLVLLLLTLFPSGFAGSTTMVIVFGEPTNYTNYETFDSWDDCLDECYDSDDCVLVYQVSSGCQLFRFGNLATVEQLSKSDAKIVGFRVTLSNTTCPTTGNPPLFDQNSTSEVYKNNQTLYNTAITLSDDTWTFEYSISTCPNNTKMFSRDNVIVCIGIRYFNGTGNQTQASELCSNDNGISLTGPYNSEEAAYLFYQTRYSIWMDGISLYEIGVFEVEDTTHNGTNAYPVTTGLENKYLNLCLYRLGSQNITDDLWCNYQFNGAMCRVDLQIIA